MTTALARTLPRVLIPAALALVGTIIGFSATAVPAHAAVSAGAYAVSLSSPLPAARREIIDGAIWRCEGDRCSAPADGARAMVICGKVARRLGPVARFTTPQGELTTEQLARCNGSN
jgi:hypothetical protein